MVDGRLTLWTKFTTQIARRNVRSLYQCGKFAQVLCEFYYGLQILGISEARWTGDGITILFSEHQDLHEYGVILILSKQRKH